jgi:hypothetical protein
MSGKISIGKGLLTITWWWYQRCNWCDACIGITSYQAFIASHRKSDAGPRIASDSLIQCISIASAKRCTIIWWHWFASLSDTMPMQCITFSMRYQCNASLFRCNTNAMHRFFDAIPIHGDLFHHIASFHRWWYSGDRESKLRFADFWSELVLGGSEAWISLKCKLSILWENF